MKQQRKVTTFYFILLLLVIIISKANVLQAQVDTTRLRQHAEIMRKAYDEGNRVKTKLMEEGKWTMLNTSSVIKFRPPLVARPGNYEYEYYKILTVPSHPDPNWPVLDFVCSQYHTLQGQTGTTFIYLEPTDKYVNNSTANVVAASSGVIVSKQDGINDNLCLNSSATGNFIALEHSNGVRSYYYQLHVGSLTQKPIGSFINEGEPIGTPGLFDGSGVTHAGIGTFVFELRDQSNNVVDPFHTGNYCFDDGISLWQDSTYMYWKVIEGRMTKFRVRKNSNQTVEGCGYLANSYSQHFNPGDLIRVHYDANWMSYSDSVLINIYNPLGVPIVTPFGWSPLWVGAYTNVDHAHSTVLPTGGIMTPGTYTVVGQLFTNYDSYASVKQTVVTYFTVGCISTFTLSSTVNGEYGKIAGNTIFSTQQCNSNSRVKYIAGNEIILQPGFNAFDGSHVMIYTEPCVVPPRLGDEDVVSLEVEKDKILISPNPARDFITVKIIDYNSKAIFKIYNSTLQLVKVLNVENASEQMISLAEFENGIYFIDAQVDSQSYKAKFVVNR